MKKKGQSAGAAGAFIALIAGFILLYMLLIPPDLRNELLGEDGSSSSGDSSGSSSTYSLDALGIEKTIISESPGRIDYLKYSKYDHPLPSINLYTTTTAKEASIGDSVYVKNGVFDRLDKNISFSLPDTSLIDNVYLSFAVSQNRNNQGVLTITLNGNQILQREIGSALANPIRLQDKDLKENNRLSFTVSGVGWKFWTTNEYELDDLKVIYDLKDISTQSSRNTITLTDVEKFNLESATLKFNPDCTPSQVGVLEVSVNREIVFSSIPDCGQLNIVEISPSILSAGSNRIEFESGRGYYLIDNINLATELKAMTYPVYYFELDERLFNTYEDDEEDEECGDPDGVCPADCPDYLDKDCCLQKSSRYWCDILPDNENNRCRAVSYESDCASCRSGYEDIYGDPPEVCEDLCGDDTDNECPNGCSKLYDMDCCFEDSETNYWCDDVPRYGLSNVCKAAIHLEDCEMCLSGYETEEGTFDCPSASEASDDESILKSRYHVWLRLKFFDDGQRKAAKVYVNGHQFYIDTSKEDFERKIDDFVEEGSNAVKIEPDRTTLDIISMDVDIEEI